jgi:ABC-2 type transport system ATP-binding protein
MGEIALTADQLVVIGRGRLIAHSSVEEVVEQASGVLVRVRSPQLGELCERLRGDSMTERPDEAGFAVIEGARAEHVGETAAAHRIVLRELTPRPVSLEKAFRRITHEAPEFQEFGTPPDPGAEREPVG